MFLKAKIVTFFMKFRPTPNNDAPEVDMNGNNNFEDIEEEHEGVFDYAEADAMSDIDGDRDLNNNWL